MLSRDRTTWHRRLWNDIEQASQSWDMASSYLVGFMEGQLAGGNDDGVLMYGYSKSLCEEFGTCSKSEHDLLRLLNFGRDLLHAQGENCAQL